MQSPNSKILYLDGLRGLAALNVVICHFFLGFYPALWTAELKEVHTSLNIEPFIARSPLNIIYNGNLAVCIFFVLSAYVLSYKFFSSRNLQIVIQSAARRYMRLVIPILGAMVLIWIVMKFKLLFNQQAAPITLSFWWLKVFWTFEPNFLTAIKQGLWDSFFDFKQENNYNLVLWTMQYELKGSFLIFSVMALFGNIKKRIFIYGVASVLFINSYYLAFIWGLWLSDLFNSDDFRSLKDKLTSSKLLFYVLLGLGVITGTYFDDNKTLIYTAMNFPFFKKLNIDSTIFYHILAAVSLSFSILCSKKLQTFLSTKFCLFLGRISFSMYLIHILVICSLSSYLFMLGYSHGFSYKLSVLFAFVPSIPVLFGISWLMAKYLDEPSITISKAISDRLLK